MTESEFFDLAPHAISRDEAVRRLREHLATLTDEDHSLCEVAARKGIFCHGFARYSDEELRRKYANLDHLRPKMSRRQLENLANVWQLARQMVDRVALACDAQAIEKDTCRGWDGFSNEELARFCAELLHLNVIVTENGALMPL